MAPGVPEVPAPAEEAPAELLDPAEVAPPTAAFRFAFRFILVEARPPRDPADEFDVATFLDIFCSQRFLRLELKVSQNNSNYCGVRA